MTCEIFRSSVKTFKNLLIDSEVSEPDFQGYLRMEKYRKALVGFFSKAQAG